MTDFKDEKKLWLMCNAERQFSSLVNRNLLLHEGFCLKIVITRPPYWASLSFRKVNNFTQILVDCNKVAHKSLSHVHVEIIVQLEKTPLKDVWCIDLYN